MRILLGSNALYFPAHGGGERSNRMLLEGLAARGHRCFVITRIDRFGPTGDAALEEQLAARGIAAAREESALRFELNGVEVLAATQTQSFRAFFTEHKNLFRPEAIITSTDDPAQLLLEAALHDREAPTVFLTRATIALPFGPDAAFASAEKTDVLRQADAIVCVSTYVANYVRQHGGMDAIHLPITPAEPGPYPRVGRFGAPYVTMVNPCAVKGISIFLELARSLPEVAFAGVPTWGTTPEDIEAMRRVSNITVLAKVDRINDLLAQTRVLLTPSVWAEARSRIVVDAMLAGVPVMASDVGGLPEAKMGVPYVLPVAPVSSYVQRLNEQFVPVADVPRQNIEPWRAALIRLLGDEEHWRAIADASRAAALHYAETATPYRFEEFVRALKRKPKEFRTRLAALPSAQLAQLSPERRKLVEARLRAQKPGQEVNPALPFEGLDTTRLRLFCFAHAGGGASFFRTWRRALLPSAICTPVQYPGRENRRSEAPAKLMPELIRRLLADLGSALEEPFALFGHSMGAIVGFELARELRRLARKPPLALFVSAARAPQFRLGHVAPPDPTREELVAEIRTLGGLPAEVVEDEKAIELMMPALAADTALYRRYSYEPEAPLAVPVFALGGEDDPNVRRYHLEAWREQTTKAFRLEMFAGGHFYLRESELAAETIAVQLRELTEREQLS